MALEPLLATASLRNSRHWILCSFVSNNTVVSSSSGGRMSAPASIAFAKRSMHSPATEAAPLEKAAALLSGRELVELLLPPSV